jgi:hypothetical protein
MRKINVALYKGRSWISTAIRWISWGTYSHSAIMLPEEGGIIYESWDGVGVRCGKNISDGHTPGTVVDVFSIMVTPEQYERIVVALKSQLGKKYDYCGAVRFVPFFRLFMGSKPSQKERADWFCSEYNCWAFEQGGIYLLNKPYYKISPSDEATSPLLTFEYSTQTVKSTPTATLT